MAEPSLTDDGWFIAELSSTTNSWSAFTMEFRRRGITHYRWLGSKIDHSSNHPYVHSVAFFNKDHWTMALLTMNYVL